MYTLSYHEQIYILVFLVFKVYTGTSIITYSGIEIFIFLYKDEIIFEKSIIQHRNVLEIKIIPDDSKPYILVLLGLYEI